MEKSMPDRDMVLVVGGVCLLALTLVVSAATAPPINVQNSPKNIHSGKTSQGGTSVPERTMSRTGTTEPGGTAGANTPLTNGTLIGIQGGGPEWHQYGSVLYLRNGSIQWSSHDAKASYFGVEPLPNGSVVAAFMASGYKQCGPYSAPCSRTGYRIIDPKPKPHIVSEWSFPVRNPKDSEVHKVVPLSHGRMLMTDMEHERIMIVKHGQITWQWDASSFYHSPNDPTKRDWLHVNDVNRLGPGKYLVSVRNANQLLVIQRQDHGGKVVQVINKDRSDANDDSCKQPNQLIPNASANVRCGDPTVLNHQHNPQWIGDRTVLVADSDNNRAVELTRQSNGRWRPTWTLYRAGGLSLRWPRDADRLPNGDTLITDSLHKRVIEVNSAGDLVWSVGTKQIPYSADRLPYGEDWSVNVSNGSNLTHHSSSTNVSKHHQNGTIVSPNSGTNKQIPLLSTLLVGLRAVFPALPYWFNLPQLALSIVSVALVGVGAIDWIWRRR